jgi:hypothetical protein
MTTTRLAEELDDLATEAGTYPRVDDVIAAARRRRRRRTVLAAAAVLVVALGGAAATALPRPGPAPVLTAAWPVPAASPRPLPATGPVARGAYAYTSCAGNDCLSYLVTADGRRFALPGAGSLSPDGRWLGYPESHDRYVVRDLTGDRVWPVDDVMFSIAWSADGRWLLLTDGTEPRQKWYVRLDTRTGDQRRSDRPLGFAEGVLPSGEILYAADPTRRPAGAPAALTRSDPVSGAAAKISLEAPNRLVRPGESVVNPEGHTLTVRLGSGGVLLGVHGPTGLTGLLAYDPSDGHLMARHDVPSRTGEWTVVGYRSQLGIVLTHRTAEGVDVVLLDPLTGASQVPLTVPGMTSISVGSAGR